MVSIYDTDKLANAQPVIYEPVEYPVILLQSDDHEFIQEGKCWKGTIDRWASREEWGWVEWVWSKELMYTVLIYLIRVYPKIAKGD